MKSSPAREMPNLVNRRAPVHYVTALNTLMRLGVDITKVDILAVGEYENYHGEIQSQTPAPGTELGRDTRIALSVGYPSAVDQMPYQFFYGLGGVSGDRSGWEERARSMMAPFDAVVIRYEAEALYQTMKLNFGYVVQQHLRRFVELFGVDTGGIDLSQRDLLLLAAVLPSFNEWSGNPRLVAEVLELFLGYRFEIVESIPWRYEIPENLQYHLGAGGRLGRESVLGRDFVNCDSAYQVVIHRVDPADVTGLLPGMQKRRILDWLLRFAMPGDLTYDVKMKLSEMRNPLGSGHRPSRLGYTTYVRTSRFNSDDPQALFVNLDMNQESD